MTLIKILIKILVLTLLLTQNSISQTSKKHASIVSLKDDTVIYKPTYVPNCNNLIFSPILKKDIFMAEYFQIHSDSLSAVEIAKLNNGDTLLIEHSGCDSGVYIFRFKTKRFQFDNIKLWHNAVDIIASEICNSLNTNFGMYYGLKALNEYAKTTKKPKYNVDIPYFDRAENMLPSDKVKGSVKFIGVKELDTEYYELSIRFAFGPIGSL
jgi:hypothetical protein